ncbi:mechanosensitive ion channel family protein [Desulfoferrobacter suflitae]|uniref:mechanosensitive ion channel family protein n=1 Tax=Desulfoferrobacter suflitae TaxID=2865782 RepID=UPI0021642378|nr:mechanosensitive ion channel family protein [Desulfoferrobacter suflitae]MCK8601067.1 mechanosensitive ion channel family protein [Desulfoferrobacter suflitae]
MDNLETILMRIRQAGSDALFIRILLTISAVLVLFFVLKMINGVARKITRDLDSWSGVHIPPIKIQSFELISTKRVAEILKALVRAGRFALWVITLYVFIPIVLSFFPRTREIVRTYLSYIIAPFNTILQGFLSFIPNLFFLGLVGLATRYVLKFTRLFFCEMERGRIAFSGFHQEWVQPTHKLLRLLIIVLAVVVASPYLPGFGSPAFQGISIFFGVLLSLGSTAAIANIVAGVAITYMRPFKVGDRVKIADTMGDVIEKTLLITRVRTIKNVEVTIPNSMVLGSHMINYSALAGEAGLILHTAVTIGYDVPWRQVHELLLVAARATPEILREPPPFVLQTALNDYSVSYELNVYTATASNLLKILSELHQNMQDKFNEANIEIMSPSYSALRDGNQPTIPEDYLPKTTVSKGFRILPVESQQPGQLQNVVRSGRD